MKKIASSLRLDLASYRALEAFSQLGTEVDAQTQRQLDRGASGRAAETGSVPQPYPLVGAGGRSSAATQGLLDDLRRHNPDPAVRIGALKHVRQRRRSSTQLTKTGELPDDWLGR
jgi:F-type H+-transporting ATPase subunit alpha